VTTERSSFRPIDWPLVATCVGLALATFVRGWLVASRDFPLNDGALFYLMTEELGTNAFRLPTMTAYNAANIPFAYSPLGFYVASALHLGLGIGLVDLFRFLPFFFGSLCVVAFFLLARDLVPSRPTVAAAVCTFAVLPRSFLWLIMGGGLTRSLGFLFAILALWQLHRAFTRQAWRNVVGATLVSALTVLTGPARTVTAVAEASRATTRAGLWPRPRGVLRATERSRLTRICDSLLHRRHRASRDFCDICERLLLV